MELESVRGPLGLLVERDRYFNASKTIAPYIAEARPESSARCVRD
ncbi:MAG: DUF2958 domain-containing protein [Alphaproteobacteria bacterium]